eukprot:290630_1
MTTYTLYLLIITIIKCKTFPSQISGNISCNEILSGVFNYSTNSPYNESHYYQLVITSSYKVHFKANCSDANTISQLHILNNLGEVVSDPYCSDTNECSNCSINITIPLHKGTYFVKITPYTQKTTTYKLNINCSPNCNYYAAGNDVIVSSHRVFDSIKIIDDIEIELDIKINQYCNESICNLLTVGDTHAQFIEYGGQNVVLLTSVYIGYPSLSINAEKNYFNISLRDSTHINEIYVPNANEILPKDNKFHHIYLSLKRRETLFIIDDITYYSSININLEQSNRYFVSELEEMNKNNLNSSTIWHPSYPLYVSNPWNVAMNGTIRNVCIRSEPNIVGNIQCNENINTIQNIIVGDIKYFKLILSAYVYEIKFNLVALRLKYQFSFRIYDINFEVLYNLESKKYSPAAMKDIIINSLDAGDYLVQFEFIDRINSFTYQRDLNVPLWCNYKQITDKYVMYPAQIDTQWLEAQLHCENKYGTSLATIISQQDIKDAIDIINSTAKEYIRRAIDLKLGHRADFYSWIGMYKLYEERINDSQWQWVDGSNCEYKGTGYCINDSSLYQQNLRTCSKECQPGSFRLPTSVNATVGSYLFLIQPEYIEELGTYAILQAPIGTYDIDAGSIDGFLCNAPNNGYPVPNCNNMLNCWKRIQCCNDSTMNGDIVLEYHDTKFD